MTNHTVSTLDPASLTFLDSGAFKTVYELDADHVLKVCHEEEIIYQEEQLYFAAQATEFGRLFAPTTFIYMGDELCYIIQHRATVAQDFSPFGELDSFTDDWSNEYKGQLHELYEAGLITQDEKYSLNLDFDKITRICGDPYFVISMVEYYGAAYTYRFFDFIAEYNIKDLHIGNLGYIDGRPVIIDWLTTQKSSSKLGTSRSAPAPERY